MHGALDLCRGIVLYEQQSHNSPRMLAELTHGHGVCIELILCRRRYVQSKCQ